VKIDGNLYRKRRFRLFCSLLDELSILHRPIRILDIGGTASYWRALAPLWSDRSCDITIVNLESETADDGDLHIRAGDACALEYADNSFDVVHSNSVIEHVGHWEAMTRMADEVRRLAPRYFLQTPNFWFPVEPHYRRLFFHWYPEIVRARMLASRRHGFRKATDLGDAMRNIQTVNLLGRTELGTLFPDAEIVRERIGPLTKSLIALRRSAPRQA
jgi:ubiquinone/menaquinone biosynthesis C-methylase UbiE